MTTILTRRATATVSSIAVWAISSRSVSPNGSRAPAKLVKLVNALGYQSGVAPGPL